MHAPLLPLFLGASPRRLERGEALMHQGDPVESMALVVTGRLVLSRPTAEGGQIILQRAGPGDVLAEASAYSACYHCAAHAAEASEVLLTPRGAFRARLEGDAALAALWSAHLAHAVQKARLRAEIRSLRGVAARLDAWLAAGLALPEKGHLQDLAAEIGVSREALYRELARRR